MNTINKPSRGPWQQTFTGRKFHPLDPRPEEVWVEDIGHALAKQCRFGGACLRHYSVAEHCLRVGWRVWLLSLPTMTDGEFIPVTSIPLGALKQLAQRMLAGVLHDGSEAYVIDVPRPLKIALLGYAEIEQRVMLSITERFGLDAGAFELPAVKKADEELLITEARDLMAEPPEPWTFRADVSPSTTTIPRIVPDAREVARTYVGTVEALTRIINADLAPRARRGFENLINDLHESGYGMEWATPSRDEWRVKVTDANGE